MTLTRNDLVALAIGGVIGLAELATRHAYRTVDVETGGRL